eukprot:comp21333_c0_seq1/m.29232 comp21333_c0_seq1/g.29232  ORF comp21333_c0_seq1/g.29232 comp21333_c0_seq1/m.29232 type:complete len:288 (-) comp21333_c0_seq1:343-1206(-)
MANNLGWRQSTGTGYASPLPGYGAPGAVPPYGPPPTFPSPYQQPASMTQMPPPQQQPIYESVYASSQSSYTADVSTAHLMQEVKLYKNNQEREKYDNMADLFAIVQTTEHLEKAYIKDSITPREYTPACEKLIAQFKTCMNLLKDEVPSLEAFMKEYKLSCPAALSRLNIGVPATVEHGGVGEGEQKKLTQYVAETVQYFITLLDALRLGMLAVDSIHPQLNDLLESMNRIKSLPPDFVSKVKIREWLVGANQMKAYNELSEEQSRQLAFDVEQAYGAFHKSLAGDG